MTPTGMTPTGALRSIVLVAALVAAMAGCSASSASTTRDARSEVTAVVPLVAPSAPDLPVTVTSEDGRSVTVDDVTRILPVTSGVAEIVFSLGLGDRVVGRDIGTTFDQAALLPVITRAHDVSAEGVLALRPTVVLADATAGPPEALQQIRSAGVPVVVVPEAWELADVAPRIRAVAEALGVAKDGERLVDRTENDIEQARTSLGSSPTIAFLYLRGQASIYLLGGDGAGADSLVEALGAVDAGTQAGLEGFTPMTAEAMVAAQPDVLLVMDKGLDSVGGREGLKSLPGIAQTTAGRNGTVVSVDDGLLLSFGPRTGAVLRLIAQEVKDREISSDAVAS